ncbi:Cuticle protein 6 [Penaeus vannamei]|uniref:Cuticle protein 6 n=1 Tax=Penaeus vannamei TaxID=6689 RepID=A0A3R7QNV1_PENVA|nr:Cuticle protein 6 [Penaeus vannamei]
MSLGPLPPPDPPPLSERRERRRPPGGSSHLLPPPCLRFLPGVRRVPGSEVTAAGIKEEAYELDEIGQYSFGYAGGASSRAESRDAFGVVRGSYNYVDSEGKIQTQHYVADALGFHPPSVTPNSSAVHNPAHATSYRVLN